MFAAVLSVQKAAAACLAPGVGQERKSDFFRGSQDAGSEVPVLLRHEGQWQEVRGLNHQHAGAASPTTWNPAIRNG